MSHVLHRLAGGGGSSGSAHLHWILCHIVAPQLAHNPDEPVARHGGNGQVQVGWARQMNLRAYPESWTPLMNISTKRRTKRFIRCRTANSDALLALLFTFVNECHIYPGVLVCVLNDRLALDRRFSSSSSLRKFWTMSWRNWASVWPSRLLWHKLFNQGHPWSAAPSSLAPRHQKALSKPWRCQLVTTHAAPPCWSHH